MKRQWETERVGMTDPTLAAVLCYLADGEFVESVLRIKTVLDATPAQAVIVADRNKTGPDGRVVPKGEVGSWVVTDYLFRIQAPVDDPVIDQGWVCPVPETPEPAQHLVESLSAGCDVEFLESLVQVHSLLERIGGQVYLKSVHRDGRPVGYLWHYEHIAALLRKRETEPDATWDEPEMAVESVPKEPVTDERSDG